MCCICIILCTIYCVYCIILCVCVCVCVCVCYMWFVFYITMHHDKGPCHVFVAKGKCKHISVFSLVELVMWSTNATPLVAKEKCKIPHWLICNLGKMQDLLLVDFKVLHNITTTLHQPTLIKSSRCDWTRRIITQCMVLLCNTPVIEKLTSLSWLAKIHKHVATHPFWIFP